jgi:hypothetical protein
MPLAGPDDLPVYSYRLQELEDAAANLRVLFDEARQRVAHENYAGQPRVIEALKPLIEFGDAVYFRKPNAGDPDEARRLTLELLDLIRDGDIEVAALRNGQLTLNDPTAQRELREIEAELRMVERNRNAFRDRHAKQLVEEKQRGQMLDLHDAMEGTDPAAVRAALGIEDVRPAVGLTTSRLTTAA